MTNGQGIENHFVVMMIDNGKKRKDIRQELSLGYQDVKKRDKRSLMDRIKEFFVDIKPVTAVGISTSINKPHADNFTICTIIYDMSDKDIIVRNITCPLLNLSGYTLWPTVCFFLLEELSHLLPIL